MGQLHFHSIVCFSTYKAHVIDFASQRDNQDLGGGVGILMHLFLYYFPFLWVGKFKSSNIFYSTKWPANVDSDLNPQIAATAIHTIHTLRIDLV